LGRCAWLRHPPLLEGQTVLLVPPAPHGPVPAAT
jgi:hypothetical protein